MARKVTTAMIDVDGEKRVVHYFEKPSASFVLAGLQDKKAGKEREDGEMVRLALLDRLCKDRDGTRSDAAFIDDILFDEPAVLLEIQKLLVPAAAALAEGAKDAEKNA